MRQFAVFLREICHTQGGVGIAALGKDGVILAS